MATKKSNIVLLTSKKDGYKWYIVSSKLERLLAMADKECYPFDINGHCDYAYQAQEKGYDNFPKWILQTL